MSSSYDSIYVRKDYAHLAKVVHSVSGTITTVFLFTRLWARGNTRKGLWIDDCLLTAAWLLQVIGNGFLGASPAYGFNILTGTTHGTLLQFIGACSLYVAICLSKNAFATTVLRLASGWAQALLYSVIILGSAFTVAVVIVSWIPACGVTFRVISITGMCLSPSATMWIQTGYCLCMVLSDVVLTCLPWKIIQGVKYIPANEKWNVALSMSLVGIAGLVEIARIVFSMSMPYHLFGELDFTYGIVATYCLIQAECAVFIIAQSIPVIRVMLQSGGPSPASRLVSSVAEPDHGAKGKQPATAVPAAEENVELVQLASGKIVRADSEEGWAHRAAEEQHEPAGKKGEPAGEGGRGRRLDLLEPAGVRSGNNRGSSLVAVDDEVHRIWMELGLSKRAWSQSPGPVAAAAAGARLWDCDDGGRWRS